tara:strand:- start:14395 stop:16632 length:2238 start_codon:yes stop_codon:yes gene_type:complete
MSAGFSKSKIFLGLLMALICILPTSAGQYSDIAFMDATMTPSASESRTTDLNPNGTYLASGYEKMVAIHDVETLELISTFEVQSDVLDVEFSPDGNYLAFSRSGSSADTNTIQIINVDTMVLTSKIHGSNSQSRMVQWSPDGSLLAIPNSNNGVDILRIADMQTENTMNGEHNTRVTCISYSHLGSYILTGDESGRVVMWTSEGNPTGKEWTLDSRIQDCGFDSADERFAVFTEEGDLSTWSFAGGKISNLSLERGAALQWSSDNSAIHILEAGVMPRIVTLESTSLEESSSIYLTHQAMDFSIKENQFGTRELAFIATNTGHIAVYGAISLPEGYGESGADLDGDNVPDTFDQDDDGDSITDSLDNNCQSVSQVCSKTPDIDSIRSVEITVDSTNMILRDTFTLDSETSSIMRNLSRRSLVADSQLSTSEEELFANAICKNMNGNHYMSSWKNVIELSSGQLLDGSVDCEIYGGMTITAQNDYRTRVAVTYVIVFNLSEEVQYPFEFTMQSQPTATDSSLAQHAEMHPIDISALSSKSVPVYWSPWWVIEGDLTLILEEEIESEPSFIGKIIELFIDSPVLLIPIIAIMIGGVLVVIRRQNSIDMDLEDDKDSEKEEHDENDSDPFDEGVAEIDEESDSEREETTVEKSEPRETMRKPRQESTNPPAVTRRKARPKNDEDDGPITKVKRRRLDSSLPTSSNVTTRKTSKKRKVVTQEKKKSNVKTRRVVTSSSEDKSDSGEPGK